MGFFMISALKKIGVAAIWVVGMLPLLAFFTYLLNERLYEIYGF